LGQLRYRGRQRLADALGRQGLKRLGKTAWRRVVNRTVMALMVAFLTDYVVVGGGNAKLLDRLPPGVRHGNNLTAFRGGFRLWGVPDVRTLSTEAPPTTPVTPPTAEWRMI
jgi:hypothetical protein